MGFKDLFKNNVHIKQAGNLPFSNMLGIGLPLTDVKDARDAIPGALILDVETTIGNNCRISTVNNVITASAVQNSTINVQMRNLYNFVRSKNSGSINYAPVDMSMYLLYNASLLSFIVETTRLLTLSNTVSFYNKYKCAPLLEGFGLDADEFIADKPKYISKLNYLIDRFNSLAKPTDFKLYSGIATWFSGAVADEDTDKAQLYFLRNASYRYWSGITYQTGTALIRVTSAFSDYQTWSELADELFGPVGVDQDLNIISGDIIKSGVSLFHMNHFDPDAHSTLQINHDMSALEAIHNCVIYPVNNGTEVSIDNGPEDISLGDIVQDANESIVQPVLFDVTTANAGAAVYSGHLGILAEDGVILDVINQKTPPAEVVVNAATMLSLPLRDYIQVQEESTYHRYGIIEYPSVLIPVRATVVVIPTSGGSTVETFTITKSIFYSIGASAGHLTPDFLCAVTQFNMYPKLMEGGDKVKYVGEIDNFEMVNKAESARLSNAIIAYLHDFNSVNNK